MNTIKLKQHFWFIFSVMGIIFFWAGIWDGLANLPYIKAWWTSLLVGLGMFIFSGFVLKENDLITEMFLGSVSRAMKIIHTIHRHPEKHLFQIKYSDKLTRRENILGGHKVHHIEKDYIVFLDGQFEKFIPAHRITEILHKGKTHWKQ